MIVSTARRWASRVWSFDGPVPPLVVEVLPEALLRRPEAHLGEAEDDDRGGVEVPARLHGSIECPPEEP
jgi:hypothetical protein